MHSKGWHDQTKKLCILSPIPSSYCTTGRFKHIYTRAKTTQNRCRKGRRNREIRPHTPWSMPLRCLSCPKATSFPLSTMHGRKGLLSTFLFLQESLGWIDLHVSERPSEDKQENSFWFLDGSGNSVDEKSSSQQNGSGLLERQSLGGKETCLFLSCFSFFQFLLSFPFPLQGCSALVYPIPTYPISFLEVPSLTCLFPLEQSFVALHPNS